MNIRYVISSPSSTTPESTSELIFFNFKGAGWLHRITPPSCWRLARYNGPPNPFERKAPSKPSPLVLLREVIVYRTRGLASLPKDLLATYPLRYNINLVTCHGNKLDKVLDGSLFTGLHRYPKQGLVASLLLGFAGM